MECEICNLHTYLNKDWYNQLKAQFSKQYFKNITQKLHSPKQIYPPLLQVFSFANYFNINETRVVIMGQDPYHGPKQANGLAFSVEKSCRIPPSLRNIFKELNIKKRMCGDLTPWARQGVLLLNNSLTVFKGEANSHKKFGWDIFVDAILKIINDECKNVVFILWGRNAWEKEKIVDIKKHLVLKSVHPSPLSANRGFFGCNHFTLANEYLEVNGREVIDWLAE